MLQKGVNNKRRLDLTNQDSVFNQISTFVDNARKEASPRPRSSGQQHQEDAQEAIGRTPQARQMILDAEQFRASVAAPQGKHNIDDLFELIQSLKTPSSEDNDDDFFHITCHIDPSMKNKIMKGEFVDLEKLLPKVKHNRLHADKKIELLHELIYSHDNDSTYISTGERSPISNVRKWEQAFRVYAAVYSEVNPSRAADIWQYVYVINTAAASYQWDNISEYDFTFRHLMASKPNRSRAKTYAQAWNLCM